MTRDERQEVCLRKWAHTKWLGTIEAFTGFGKTRIATNAIKLLRRNDATRSVVIVVPTIPLKNQWEEGLQSLGLLNNTRVVVINSLIKEQPFDCSMLVLDEIHRYAAKTFSKVFGIVRYSFVLGLTATLKRLDKKHTFLERYAPIRDKVTMVEGKRNGWMAPYMEYNLGITMDDDSAEYYRSINIKFSSYFDKFQNDFELMKQCSFTDKPFLTRSRFVVAPKVVKYARSLGWEGHSDITAYQVMKFNETAPRGEKQDMWGGQDHPYSPQKLFVYAIQGMKSIRKLINFCYNDLNKVDAAEELIRRFEGRKAITFCQSIQAADELANRLGGMALTYHSGMKSVEIPQQITKKYKTENGANMWIERNPEWKKRALATGGFSVYTTKRVKVGPKKLKEEALRKLQETQRVRVVCTAKALDMGFDFPGCQLAIIYARTSSPIQQIQRSGRALRKHFFEDGTEKRSVVINIYLKDTKDYGWLNRAQRKSAGARWVDTIDEIMEAENLRIAV